MYVSNDRSLPRLLLCCIFYILVNISRGSERVNRGARG